MLIYPKSKRQSRIALQQEVAHTDATHRIWQLDPYKSENPPRWLCELPNPINEVLGHLESENEFASQVKDFVSKKGKGAEIDVSFYSSPLSMDTKFQASAPIKMLGDCYFIIDVSGYGAGTGEDTTIPYGAVQSIS